MELSRIGEHVLRLTIRGETVEVPADIVSKTTVLFQERILNLLSVDVQPQNLAKVFQLQLVIFLIDAHYEQERSFNPSLLEKYWEKIEALMGELGLQANDIKGLLAEIRKYEKIEQLMRQGNTLELINIRDFYFYKSCDVRLNRRILRYLNAGAIPADSIEELNLDIVGEILDDLEDMDEDEGLFNGNRFLEMRKLDYANAVTEYSAFVGEIASEAASDILRDLCASVSAKLMSLNSSDQPI